MEKLEPFKIHVIIIVVSICFLIYIGYLIVKGKLREEYAIFWILSSLILIIFTFWKEGLEIISKMLGVYSAPNLIFTGAIYGIFIYLLHLSVVVSKLHDKNKKLAQEIALLKNKVDKESVNTILK